MKSDISKATARPWKAPVLWDSSGIVQNAIHQDCQPGCRFKEDTTAICYFPDDIKINRPNAELIVQAVNLFELHEALAQAAKQANNKLSTLRELARPEDVCLSEPGDCDEVFDELTKALANLEAAKAK